MNNLNSIDNTSVFNSNNLQKNTTVLQTDSTVNVIELIYHVLDNIILIIFFTIVGALLMGQITGTTTSTTYRSTSKLYLVNNDDAVSFMSSLQAADSLVNDYIALFQTKELHQTVADELNLDYSAERLKGMISVSNIDETHILSITVSGDSAEIAEMLADTYARVVSELVENKFNMPKPKVFENATSAIKSVTSNKKQSYIIGAMCGLFVSSIAVVLLAIFDDCIRTPEDIQRVTGIETLGIMTKQKKCYLRRHSGK